MKNLSILFLFLLFALSTIAQVRVSGYYRKNGTYVQPHYRSSPDGNPYNNWSYPGNTNPYTGKTATGNPETYLDNYNKRSSSTPPPTYTTPGTSYGSSSGNSYSSPVSTYSAPSNTYSSSSSTYSSPVYGSSSNARRLDGIPLHSTLKVEPDSPIRSGPSANSSILGKANNLLTYQENSNADYIQVNFNGQIGYLNKTFVMVDETRHLLQTSQYAGIVCKKIRVFQYSPICKEPAHGSTILDTADEKYVLILRDINEDYLYVEYHRVRGYMLKKFVDQ